MKVLKVKCETINSCIGNVSINAELIIEKIKEGYQRGYQVVLFPELCLTGVGCGDLILQQKIVSDVQKGIEKIIKITEGLTNYLVIFGTPTYSSGKVFNSACIVGGGRILGEVHKSNLTSQESRWFSNDVEDKFFNAGDFSFGVEIGSDMFSPTNRIVESGVDVIFNIASFPTYDHKKARSIAEMTSYIGHNDYFISSINDWDYHASWGRFYDTEETFPEIIQYKRRRDESYKVVDKTAEYPIIGNIELSQDGVFEIRQKTPLADLVKFNVAVLPEASRILAKKLSATGLRPIIGISGGRDSTLALFIALEAVEMIGQSPKYIIGVTMPGLATGERSLAISKRLMEITEIDAREISIVDMCKAELKALGHDGVTEDITYENVQARARTQVLMNLSNKDRGIVIGTGDLSELALGWCTYNGDHMAMFSINSSIPKTSIDDILKGYAWNEDLIKIVDDILRAPITPELKSEQKTEDSVGPYELTDYFLYCILELGLSCKDIENSAIQTFQGEYGDVEIHQHLEKFMSRFIKQQFKRNCTPEAPNITGISLDPIEGWVMANDIDLNKSDLW